MTKNRNMIIKVSNSDYEIIKKFADFNGKSISALMLDAVWEQIEYFEDMKSVAEYEQRKADGTLVTYSLKEVCEELGLDND